LPNSHHRGHQLGIGGHAPCADGKRLVDPGTKKINCTKPILRRCCEVSSRLSGRSGIKDWFARDMDEAGLPPRARHRAAVGAGGGDTQTGDIAMNFSNGRELGRAFASPRGLWIDRGEVRRQDRSGCSPRCFGDISPGSWRHLGYQTASADTKRR